MLLEDPSHFFLMPHIIISWAIPGYSWGTRSFQSRLHAANGALRNKAFNKENIQVIFLKLAFMTGPFLFMFNLLVHMKAHSYEDEKEVVYTVVYFHKT